MAKQSNILVTGCRGQLGRDLIDGLADKAQVTGIDIDNLDITDQRVVADYIKSLHPEIILHAAAYTNVDACESDESTAAKVNIDGTANIAKACREIGARMIYYSTDYVFDGEKKSPYTEDDIPNPQTAYGRTKLGGEKAVADILNNYAIVRIAWVYGRYGQNFLKTMLNIGTKYRDELKNGGSPQTIKVVNDQIGNPTWTGDIVAQTGVLLVNSFQGIFHSTAEEPCTWYNFAGAIFAAMLPDIEIRPCTSDEFPRPARRPKFSALENARLKAVSKNIMRPWHESLDEFLTNYGDEILHEVRL